MDSNRAPVGQDGAVQLRGRVGVVTGADSDVGTAIARNLAAEGMSLMLIARPGHHVRALAEDLEREHGIRCFPASADVADPGAVDRLGMHAEQHLGGIDGLVNTRPGNLTAALLPTMDQRGRGAIVNVGVASPEESAPSAVRVTNIDRNEPTTTAEVVTMALREA